VKKYRKARARKREILETYYQVLAREGFEGASIGKIAERMGVHPSLIIHYFKTKENMTIELVDLLIEKYEAPEFLRFDHVPDGKPRFAALMDTLFSLEWSRTVDPGVHFGFYYLSFRHPVVRERFEAMLKRFRDYLAGELEHYIRQGVVRATDARAAADFIVTLMEGLELHAHFLADGQPFEHFAGMARKAAVQMLTGETEATAPRPPPADF